METMFEQLMHDKAFITCHLRSRVLTPRGVVVNVYANGTAVLLEQKVNKAWVVRLDDVIAVDF